MDSWCTLNPITKQNEKAMRLAIVVIIVCCSIPGWAQLKQQNIYKTDHKYYQMGDKEFSFNSLDKKVVLVKVWAEWCAGCISDHPKVVELEKELNNPDFGIVYLAMSKETEKWEAMVEKKGWEGIFIEYQNDLSNPLSKIVYQPKEKDGQTYYEIAVPNYFVIGPDGTGFKTSSPNRPQLREDIERLLGG